MSHAIRLDRNITNLLVLRQAAEACGPLELEVMKGLTLAEDGKLYDAQGNLYTGKGSMHYRTYKDGNQGKWVGDWPTPEGMTAEETGDNAVAVIRIKGDNAAYEIGVVPKGDGTFTLCHDFWGPGRQIEKYVGATTTGPGHTVKEAYGDLVQKYNAILTGVNCAKYGVSCDYVTREELIAMGLAEAKDLPNDGSLYAIADKENQGIRVMEGG